MKILVVNGPNLNFLGVREPNVYGGQTYRDLETYIEDIASEIGVEAVCFQSNHEGMLIDRLQEAYHEGMDGIVINPGALTHYSYALLDAIKAIGIPTIEVHISNVHQRESFRHTSVTASACIGQIVGLGFTGYGLAMRALVEATHK